MDTKGSISRKKELQVLKRQAKDIEARLRSLGERIRAVEHGLSSVFQAIVDPEKCVGCGICQDLCPTGAISLEQIARVDPARCTGCGCCVGACPQMAVSLHLVKPGYGKKARAAF